MEAKNLTATSDSGYETTTTETEPTTETEQTNSESVPNFIVEQGLRDIYYNPKTGYQSMERLYQKARSSGLNVTRVNVKEWLGAQHTYTRFKPI